MSEPMTDADITITRDALHKICILIGLPFDTTRTIQLGPADGEAEVLCTAGGACHVNPHHDDEMCVRTVTIAIGG